MGKIKKVGKLEYFLNMQKELKKVISTIQEWVNANEGEVSFVGSFVSFDKKKIEKDEDDVIKDAVCVGYGDKESVKLSLEELMKQLEAEKKEFINW